MDDVAQIKDAEARLRAAMLDGDIDALEALLSADTVFTNQVGARFGKSDDIATHQSGLLQLDRIDPAGQALIRVLGDSAIVVVAVDLAGSYDGLPFGGTFAYTRLWHRHEGGPWQIAAAHCSPANGA